VLREAIGAPGDELCQPAPQQPAGAGDLRLEGRDPADRRALGGRLEVDLAAVVADRCARTGEREAVDAAMERYIAALAPRA
jgi:hypothetical protein